MQNQNPHVIKSQKPKQSCNRQLHAKRKKKLCTNETCHEKKVLSDKTIWYKSMDPAEKEKLLSHRAEWYKSLDPKEKKKKLLFKSAE